MGRGIPLAIPLFNLPAQLPAPFAAAGGLAQHVLYHGPNKDAGTFDRPPVIPSGLWRPARPARRLAMAVSVLEHGASCLTDTRPLAELAPEVPAGRQAVNEAIFRTPVPAPPARPRRTLFSSLRQTSARPSVPPQDPGVG